MSIYTILCLGKQKLQKQSTTTIFRSEICVCVYGVPYTLIYNGNFCRVVKQNKCFWHSADPLSIVSSLQYIADNIYTTFYLVWTR